MKPSKVLSWIATIIFSVFVWYCVWAFSLILLGQTFLTLFYSGTYFELESYQWAAAFFAVPLISWIISIEVVFWFLPDSIKKELENFDLKHKKNKTGLEVFK